MREYSAIYLNKRDFILLCNRNNKYNFLNTVRHRIVITTIKFFRNKQTNARK